MSEEKAVSIRRAKFAALATKRVNKATQAIRVIGNLSNRSNYEYGEADVQAIVRELSAAVTSVRRRFSTGSDANPDSFRILP